MTRRARLVAAGAAVLVVALIALVVVGTHGASRRPNARPPAKPVASRRSTPVARPDSTYHPSYLPAKPGVASPFPASQVAALETLNPPSPAYPPSLPALPASAHRDAYDFSLAFTAELLDISFARTSRSALARWAQAEAAAELIQGVPLRAAKNSLYASLFDPGAIGGTAAGDPVPSASTWTHDARSGVVWRVSKLTTAVYGPWQDALASASAGSIRDPLLTVYQVTGTLRVYRPGRHVGQHPFTLTLTMGSALHEPGYGAGVVQWRVR